MQGIYFFYIFCMINCHGFFKLNSPSFLDQKLQNNAFFHENILCLRHNNKYVSYRSTGILCLRHNKTRISYHFTGIFCLRHKNTRVSYRYRHNVPPAKKLTLPNIYSPGYYVCGTIYRWQLSNDRSFDLSRRDNISVAQK